MNIIKFDAIDSTSLFLKDLSKNNELENLTTIVADLQSHGKGQMDSRWHAEDGKNLLFTSFVDLKGLSPEFLPTVSFLIALKLSEILKQLMGNSHKIRIKWPNDIMSYNKKVAGILVENTIKKGKVSACFVGVGLNVNQLIFPNTLPKAISMATITGVEYDRDVILKSILSEFKKAITIDYITANCTMIKQNYLMNLYKSKTPSMFKDKEDVVFMAKIADVSNSGLLILEKEDGLLYRYAVKEISSL